MSAELPRPPSGRGAPRSAAVALVALAAIAVLLVPGTSRADPPAPHAVLRDFSPTGKYVFTAEGSTQKSTVYFSQRAASYLVRGSSLGSPFLVRTGAASVEAVTEEDLIAKEGGGVDVRAGASPKPLGRFSLEGTDIVIRVEGLTGRLRAAPYLLGWGKQSNLTYHTPEYARDARVYAPDANTIQALRCDTRKVQVFVYFASWCSTCTMLLGRIVKLEQETTKDHPNFTFDYYGLPQVPQMYQDPEVVQRRIEKLPTGLVYVDGQYVGRIVGLDWRRPEAALRNVLGL